MTDLDLSACAKLAVIWITNPNVPLHSEPNTRFDLSYLSFFIANFVYYYLIYPPKFLSKNE